MLAEKVKEGIERKLREGCTVYLSTHYKHFKITPKSFERQVLFKIDKQGNLRYQGKIICHPNMLLVKVTVE